MTALQTWLNEDYARRNIFIVVTVYDVVAVQDITLYLSNCHFITTDSLTVFNPIVAGNFSISENLSIDGGYSISYGDINLYNNDGEYDIWLDSSKYVWTNRSIKVYVGDSTWTCAGAASIPSTFHLIFDGIVTDMDAKSIDRLSIKVRDKQEQINTPVTEDNLDTDGTWEGEQPNKDSIKPLVFGEVHNIEPVLIDPATLKYRFSTGLSEQVIEIRDNGVPIYTYPSLTTGATIDLANSTFTLTYPAVGQITASIQGRKRSINFGTEALSDTYTNNVANIIAIICIEYGKIGATNLTAADIDLSSFSSIESAAPYPVGIYLGTEKQNIVEVCRQLAESIGAQLFFNRFGKLQLIRIGTYISGSGPSDITEDNMIFNSLRINQRMVPVASTKIAYCKNWTIQEGIVTGIPDAHKEMFATEWYYSTTTDSAVKTKYKLNSEVTPKETLLLTTASAAAESSRLNTYWKSPRTVYSFTGKASLLSLSVGQQVTLFHHRFGLWNSGSGTSGQVISTNPDWVTGLNQIEVII